MCIFSRAQFVWNVGVKVRFVFFIILSSRLCQGDARYLISNSKDQSIKLWDVRKFSPKEGLAASRLAVTQQNWDYRWQQVPQRGEEGDEAEGLELKQPS